MAPSAQQLLNNNPKWLADGMFYQVCVISALVEEDAIPCAFALIANKSETTYTRGRLFQQPKTASTVPQVIKGDQLPKDVDREPSTAGQVPEVEEPAKSAEGQAKSVEEPADSGKSIKPANEPAKAAEPKTENEEQEAPPKKKETLAGVVSMVMVMKNWLRNGEPESDNIPGDKRDSMISSLLGPASQASETTVDEGPLPWKQRIINFVTQTVNTSHSWFYYWSFLVALTYMYNLFVIIGRAAFIELDEYNDLWFSLDYLFDLINLVDVALHFRIGYLEDGIVMTDHKKLAINYVNSKTFRFDIVSILPTDIFYLAVGTQHVWLRMNRLLRFERINRFAEATESRTSFPNAFRVFRLILNIFIIFHWNGCVYFLISRLVGFEKDTWVFRYGRILNPSVCVNSSIDDEGFGICFERQEIIYANLTKQYVFSLYWSALILTTIGEQQPPVSLWEHIFVISDILLGLLIFASIVGNVGTMITNMNASKTEFQENMDGAKMYIKNRKVVKQLSRKTVAWFDYMWSQGQSLDEEAILDQLPTKLRAELAIQVHLETLQQVHIFKDCEPGLLIELVLKLKLQILSPGDYICRKGDVGKEMYIVKRGSLNVVSEDGKKVFVTLKEGSVFGELSVMDIPGNKTGGRRSASIRSVGFSDLFVLSKDDLWDALREYPQAKALLMEKGRAILRKDNLLNENAVGVAGDKDLREKLDVIDKKLKVADSEINELYADFIKTSAEMKRMTAALERKTADLEKDIELYGLDIE